MKNLEAQLRKLRLLVETADMSVYDIHIRNAGFGIAFATSLQKRSVNTRVTSVVFGYYPTLGQAIATELKICSNPRALLKYRSEVLRNAEVTNDRIGT